MINNENWTYCCYTNNKKKSLITMGMKPDALDVHYYVTMLDENNKPLYQEEHPSLEAASQHINQKYSQIWDFTNLTVNKSDGGGCSTCIAH